jgi:shikimate kinase/3-dehydroquinate synthase
MSPGDSQNLHSNNRNLVLTGFMGTGKTSVGRQVAQELGRPFVDMDFEIEARTGKSIPRIFAEDGEPTFRRIESALCQELGARAGIVIATGGGALVDPANLAAMIQNGTIVCLTCDPDELLARVNRKDSDRPLLDVEDPGAEIERLLALRRQAYAAIPWQVATTKLPVAVVAERVLQFAGFVTLPVRHPGGEYPIHIGDGLLDHLGSALQAAGISVGGCVAVVSNPVVAALYGAQVEESLHLAGFRPVVCSVPDGEQHKTLSTVASLYDQFLAGGLDRTSLVLSLGGGVTGDMAGFAAATFMRGVRFAQVPTTILSMADASVGGNTGVDLPQGKNLAGAFKQPELVAIDPTVLVTLPGEEVRSGMAEVIKHGVIGDPDLFAELESPPPNLSSPISVSQIARTLGVKIAVVEQDPFEQGRRAVLNLGHTVGHGLEHLSGYSLRHGEAVSIGMVAAARIAAALGRAGADLAARIESALDAWGLPVRCPPYEVGAIWEAMTHDKKRRGRALRWILPHAIGQVEIVEDVAPSVVKSVLQDLGARRSE